MQDGAQGFCWRSTCLMTLARLGDGDLHQNDCGLKELGDLNGDMIPPNLLVNHQFPYEVPFSRYHIFRQTHFQQYSHSNFLQHVSYISPNYCCLYPHDIPIPGGPKGTCVSRPRSKCREFPNDTSGRLVQKTMARR